MTITVNTAGRADSYPNADGFDTDDDNNLSITEGGNTVALYFTWDSVTDDQYDVPADAATTTGTDSVINDPPPAPTPVVPTPEDPPADPTPAPVPTAPEPVPAAENAVPNPPSA